MIFRKVRRSDLEREAESRRQTFERSRADLAHAVREQARPLNFIKSHPRLVLTALGGFAASAKIAGGVPKLARRLMKWGWIWRLAQSRAVRRWAAKGVAEVFRKGVPLAFSAGAALFRKLR